MANKIIPYNPRLKQLARELRKNATLSEMILWKHVRGKAFGVEFHRQVPMPEYIIDFYCHELELAIEVDGFPWCQVFPPDTLPHEFTKVG